LNAVESQLFFDVTGFERQLKNHLILLPAGSWDGDVTKRFELPIKKVIVKKVIKSDGEKSKSPATGEKKKRVVGEKTKKKPTSGSSSPSKTKTTSEDSSAKTNVSSDSTPEKSSKIPTTEENSPKPVSDEAPKASPEESSEMSTETSSKVITPESPVAKKTAKVSSKPNLELLSPLQPSSPIKELDCEPIDMLSKQQLSEQLQLYPQGRNLSPVDDGPSDLFISDAEQLSDDDLALGASASPTMMGPGYDFGAPTGDSDIEGVTGVVGPSTIQPDDGSYPALSNFYRRKYGGDELPAWQRVNTTSSDFVPSATTETEPEARQTNGGPRGHVGLVNQAMTCYLNSLLQALFMTPEFRNALYRWEFDNDNEAKNIPYQLQKLFLNLQTSPKAAVETTDLTRSFGWDSTEAWQQHDIQELCRVMFDALEHKFKNTKQANLISNLYEGKMNDYVKCLECNTEKTREDTFLDIPLPVRPFGSSSAYGSIEEALRAFVQPETLDGNNQYLCEKCKKKCDAHKGLHFKSFPYILTLHLKRFDFDYQTMHRIKLNDR